MKNRLSGIHIISLLLACVLVFLPFVFLNHLEAEYEVMITEFGMDLNYWSSHIAFLMLFTSFVVLVGIILNKTVSNITALTFLICHLAVLLYYYYSLYNSATIQSQQLHSLFYNSFIHAINRYPEHILQALISIVLSGIVLFKLFKSDE